MPKGRPRGSRNKPKAKTMKKITTAKKAYSKPVRNQMMLRRAGVVETKVRVDSDTAANNGHINENDWEQPLAWKPLGYSGLGAGPANLGTNAFTWIPLSSFTRISRGLGDDQMIGNIITRVQVFAHSEDGLDPPIYRDFYINMLGVRGG